MRGASSPIISRVPNENNICCLWIVNIDSWNKEWCWYDVGMMLVWCWYDACSSSSKCSAFSCVTAVSKLIKLQFQQRLLTIYKCNSVYITTVIKFQQSGVLISEILITNITGFPKGRGSNSDRMFCANVGIRSSVRHSRAAPACAGTYVLKFLMWERENGTSLSQ
jgi:hypothetical protein